MSGVTVEAVGLRPGCDRLSERREPRGRGVAVHRGIGDRTLGGGDDVGRGREVGLASGEADHGLTGGT
jgi:hypothetical protein